MSDKRILQAMEQISG
ncbi:hypothetical protein ACF7IG_004479 [Escherichia coli]